MCPQEFVERPTRRVLLPSKDYKAPPTMFCRRNMSESLTKKLGYLAIIGVAILFMTGMGFVYAPTITPLLVFLALLDSLMLAIVASVFVVRAIADKVSR